MGEVVALRPKILEDHAETFVKIYKEDGKLAAASWIKNKIEDSEKDRIRLLIREAFIREGYSFPDEP